MHFDVTDHVQFGVNVLRLHSYMRSVSPLERLIENGGSPPASKHVSDTQVTLWIEGVRVPRSHAMYILCIFYVYSMYIL